MQQIFNNLHQYFGFRFIIQDHETGTQKLSGTLGLQNEETLVKTLRFYKGTHYENRATNHHAIKIISLRIKTAI